MTSSIPPFPQDLIDAAKVSMIAAGTGVDGQFADDSAIAGDIDYFIKAGLSGVMRALAAGQAQLVLAFTRVGDTVMANNAAAKQTAYLDWAVAIESNNPVPVVPPPPDPPPDPEPPPSP